MDIVDSHNYYRQLHYSSNLVDDDEVSKNIFYLFLFNL